MSVVPSGLRSAAGLSAVLLVAGLTGCAKETPAAAGSDAVTVEATDTACTLSRAEVKAGTSTFSVTNRGTKVTEFYVLGDGDKVLGEVENIGPGLKRDLIVELAAGKYTTACKPGMTGDGIRGELTVSGEAVQAVDTDAALKQAVETYQRYVATQADELAEHTAEFVAAVKANDIEKAKSLFGVARTYWERIEPVAESFGDLDPKIDAREADLEEGQKFTGFHRLEKDLWVTGLQADAPAIADGLLADVNEIVTKAKTVELTPAQLANGAKELLDEVATGKITGEEDTFSHTDLWDFAANVDGSKAAVAALRPALD